MNFANTLLNIILRIKMIFVRRFVWKGLIDQTQNPKAEQEKLLARILRKNENTVFGKEHGFSGIASYEDYKNAVSINSYENLRPYIEKQEQEKEPYLNMTQPAMYAITSGTMGKSKHIPILKESISQYRYSQHCVAYAAYESIPGVYDGKVLAIVSPSVEGYLDTGTPFGSMSGLIYQSMPRIISHKYVVPSEVFEIDDYDLKYKVISAFALSEKDVTLIATANPSTLLRISNVINGHLDELLIQVERGNRYGLNPNPIRAMELKSIAAENEKITFADLWPSLKSVTTWTAGNCAVLIPSLKNLLNDSTKIVEMGYLSSEFRGSITVDPTNNKSIPTIHENFFEFVECDAWENEEPEFLTVDALIYGKKYYVIVATDSGLYRYFINDIVEVDGQYNGTPTIRFVQKGKGVTNLTGEKLYESQVTEAVQNLKEDLDLDFDFYMMLACPNTLQYSIYMEVEPVPRTVKVLEYHLSNINIEFDSKRKSRRLKETSIVFVKDGTAEAYKKYCVDQGQREGQFKLVNLQYVNECKFDFCQYERK